MIFLFLVSWADVHGAAPGMHIYLAQKYLRCVKPVQDISKIIYVSTLWPDIRYLKFIGRAETHEKNVSLKSLTPINEENAFDVGKKLHAYVDEVREKFALSHGAYGLIADIPKKHQATFLKVLEDEVIWEKLNKPEILSALMMTFEQEEGKGKISKVGVILWHGWLVHYFQQRPSDIHKANRALQEKLFPISPQEVENWCAILRKKSQDPKIMAYVEALLSHFEDKFSTLSSPKSK